MKKELDSLKDNNAWTIVDRPKNKKILTNRWVFKIKRKQDGSINCYKARLVARGHEQKHGIDYNEVFAPVARYETIRTFLAGCVEAEMYIHQMDVVTAYVQGDLSDEIYMELPILNADEDRSEQVCQLKKPLYGLKQAGREWYKKINNYLSSIGMKKTESDPCVYVNTDEEKVIIVLYVDDLLIASKNLSLLKETKSRLMEKFKMNDLGELNDILGMKINREDSTGKIKISQERFANDLLKKFGMEESKTVATPLDPNVKLSNSSKPETQEEIEKMKTKPYRELIGGLIYMANTTRPDIAFATSTLSRFCNNPGEIHWKAAKRVLRYIKGTINRGITYVKSEEPLTAFVDADWGGDIDDRRSYTGEVFMLANGPISWGAHKQKSVALSTMEAEYMALSDATREIIYLRRLLNHMKFDELIEGQTTIYCDNQSAINLSKNQVYHGRSKHIDLRYHFSREAQERGDIMIKYLPTERMTADILTKGLHGPKHEACIKLLNMN